MKKEIGRLRILEIYQRAANQDIVDDGDYRFICAGHGNTLVFYRIPKRYLGTTLAHDSAWEIARYDIDDFIEELEEAGLLFY